MIIYNYFLNYMNINFFYKSINDILYNRIYNNKSRLHKWELLKKKINLLKKHPEKIQRVLDALAKNYSNNKNIKILDHGCGGSYVNLYLLALGYNNVAGVDIGGDIKEINFFSKLISKQNIKFIYKGKKLPFKNCYFDFIFSQQVLEHVPFDTLENFIKEENRVLKPGGVVYHQIPHKLVPYESHIKIWLLHWLPKKHFVIICKLMKKNYEFVDKFLWLQFPWVYKLYLTKYIGKTINLSYKRIKIFNNESREFLGLFYFIRKLCSLICNLPYIGYPLSIVLSQFIMLESLSFKNDKL